MRDTRKKILAAAVRVLSKRPTATLIEIAAEAGIQRMTIHRHFGSREELMSAIAMHSLDEMVRVADEVAVATGSSIDSLKRLISAVLPIADQIHFLVENTGIWKEPRLSKRLKAMDRDLASLIDQCKVEGYIDLAIPTAWIVAAIDGLMFSALKANRDGNVATNDMSRLVIGTLIQGVKSRRKKTPNPSRR